MLFRSNNEQKEYLSGGISDPFVMAVLPLVLGEEGGVKQKIFCEDPISARLCYQLENYLLPSLLAEEQASIAGLIQAVMRAEAYANSGAVGTEFGNDVDFLYTIMRHGEDCEYPVTHLTVFNTGSNDLRMNANEFQERCHQAERFAQEQNLQIVFMDTNFREVFHEKYLRQRSLYHIACVLALQGLFSVHLLSTEYEASSLKVDKEYSGWLDLVLVGCVSTESLAFYLCGAEIRKGEKARLVSKWMKTSTKNELYTDKERKRKIESAVYYLLRNKRKKAAGQRRAIRIGEPYIAKMAKEVRLCSEIEMDGQKQIMWFAVRESYGTYLVEDRVDAFVIALLTTAMHNAADIICDAPVTRRLLYQINHYLIPTMTSNMAEFYPIILYAQPTDEVLECEGAVVTGWTGGVDSMFTYMQNICRSDPAHRLTHLLVANNGAIIGDTRETFKRMVEKTEKGFAADTGLSVIGVDTNLQEILDENFLAVTAVRQTAVIAALQKLFRMFLESSAYGFSEFSFCSEKMGSYEMALLKWFETNTTVFYSAGGSFLRWQKLQLLSDFPLAQRYLHPCIYALRDNCCECEKCIRTETVLYGLGMLDRFAQVFDVQKFEEEKDWYFAKVLTKKEQTHYKEGLELLERRGIDLTNAQRLADVFMRAQGKNQKNLLYGLFRRLRRWIKEK